MKRDIYAELFIFCFCCIGCCVLALHFSWRALSSFSMSWSYPNMTASLLYKDTSLFQSSGISICKAVFLTFLRMSNQNVKRSQGVEVSSYKQDSPECSSQSHSVPLPPPSSQHSGEEEGKPADCFVIFSSHFLIDSQLLSPISICICLIRNSETNPKSNWMRSE